MKDIWQSLEEPTLACCVCELVDRYGEKNLRYISKEQFEAIREELYPSNEYGDDTYLCENCAIDHLKFLFLNWTNK